MSEDLKQFITAMLQNTEQLSQNTDDIHLKMALNFTNLYIREAAKLIGFEEVKS